MSEISEEVENLLAKSRKKWIRTIEEVMREISEELAHRSLKESFFMPREVRLRAKKSARHIQLQSWGLPLLIPSCQLYACFAFYFIAPSGLYSC